MRGKVIEDKYYTLPDIHKWVIEYFHTAGDSVPEFINHKWLGRKLTGRLGLEDKRRIRNVVQYRLKPDRIKALCRKYSISFETIEEEKDLPQQQVELSEQSELDAINRAKAEMLRRARERYKMEAN